MSLQGTSGFIAGYALLAAVAIASVTVRGGGWRARCVAGAWALPGTLALGALGGLLARGVEEPLRAVLTVLGTLALAAAGGWLIGARLTPRAKSDLWQRGALVQPAMPPAGASELHLAGLSVPPGDECKHFKILGTTGTGKSTAIRALLEGAARRGDRAVVADAGGAYLAALHDAARGDVVLNPFDAGALRWDPFAELLAPFDPELLARALISEGQGAEQAWRHYARVLVASLIRRLAAAGVRDLAELVRLLNSAPVAELRPLLEGSPAQPLVEAGNERMFASVRAVATTATAALEHVCAQPAAPFSVRRWLTDGRGWLFLPYGADQVASLQALVSTWLRLAIQAAMGGGESDRRLWIVVDELDALGPIDGLKDALVRLRKHGGRCVLGFQSMAQVSATYGAAEAQTIVENCGNTLILRCSSGEQAGTARFASALIGERELLRATPGRAPRRLSIAGAGGVGEAQRVLEPAVLPAEIEQLADFHGFAKLASGAAWHPVIVPHRAVPTPPAAAAADSGSAPRARAP